MSLHLWSLFSAHPAKLINLLALLFACPGSWLLHVTRRREQQARASLAAQAGRKGGEASHGTRRPDDDEAQAFASSIGARITTVSGPSQVAEALARVLDRG